MSLPHQLPEFLLEQRDLRARGDLARAQYLGRCLFHGFVVVDAEQRDRAHAASITSSAMRSRSPGASHQPQGMCSRRS